MKKIYSKQIVAFSIALIIIFSTFGLTGCGFKQDLEPMNFEFTLVDKDVEETLDVIEKLEKYIDNEENSKIVSTAEQVEEKLDYILHQYYVGEMKYYTDLQDDEAYHMYVSGEEAYMAVCEESLRVLEKLYKSDLPAKTEVFADWTEAELRDLEVSSEELVELEKEQKELLRQYLALENPESEEWSVQLEKIYFQFVENARQIAKLYEYDNYYDYSSKEIYMREYSEKQREYFRDNVEKYIIPLYIQMDALYQEKRDNLTEEQKNQLSSLKNDPCLQSNEYLEGYINSYPEEMKAIMSHLFDRQAVVYTESENAHCIAYSNYSNHCDQPFVFLGNGTQDLLTVVHELGHYTAFYHFVDELLPYDTCEVHSQGSEWLIMEYLDGKIDQDVYDTFLLWRLKYGLDTVILSTIIDDYEEAVYTRDEITSHEDFRTIMSNTMDSYQGIEDVITEDELYTYAQYVTIESPVYYLSYATSELASMSFYTIAQEEGYEVAQDIYIDICLKTPIDNVFLDTLIDVGLPDPFDIDTVEDIAQSFEEVFDEEILYPAA